MPVLNLYKPTSITPLEAVERARARSLISPEAKVTYAGRLDPMAQGVLLALSGESRFQKKDFLSLDKLYEANIVFGAETDSYDILGRVKHVSQQLPVREQVEHTVSVLEGKNILPYPPFSSKPVDGQPLFAWARAGKLDEIDVPVRDMNVFRFSLHAYQKLTLRDIWPEMEKRIRALEGDFRQEKILADWRTLLADNRQDIVRASVKIYCASGTYVRALAQKMGEMVACPAFLHTLTRTRVGTYRSSDSMRL